MLYANIDIYSKNTCLFFSLSFVLIFCSALFQLHMMDRITPATEPQTGLSLKTTLVECVFLLLF